jgi:hypothetical protein
MSLYTDSSPAKGPARSRPSRPTAVNSKLQVLQVATWDKSTWKICSGRNSDYPSKGLPRFQPVWIAASEELYCVSQGVCAFYSSRFRRMLRRRHWGCCCPALGSTWRWKSELRNWDWWSNLLRNWLKKLRIDSNIWPVNARYPWYSHINNIRALFCVLLLLNSLM